MRTPLTALTDTAGEWLSSVSAVGKLFALFGPLEFLISLQGVVERQTLVR